VKRPPSYFHRPTATEYQVIGARVCEAGKTFVCRNGDARERLFLVDGFDIDAAERDALWETLFETEVARTRREEKKRLNLEKRAHEARLEALENKYEAEHARDIAPVAESIPDDEDSEADEDPEEVEDDESLESIVTEDEIENEEDELAAEAG